MGSTSHRNGMLMLDVTSAPRGRRLLAYVYEILPLLAIAFGVTLPWLVFTGGEAVSADNPLFKIYVALCLAGYFLVCWKRGGQTLGMRPWRLHVLDRSGTPISWRQALIRLMVAILGIAAGGLGHLWMFIDGQHRTWHDIAAGTWVVMHTPD